MQPIMPPANTQAGRLLEVLLKANGGWVHKTVFCRDMWLTQAGSVIWNLEHRYHWPIEHSDFTDEHGFKSYRLPKQNTVVI